MYLGYLSFYFIVFGFLLFLFIKKSDQFNRLLFLIVQSFLIFYLIFILVPSWGPQFYFFSPINQAPEGGFSKKIVSIIQITGESKTALSQFACGYDFYCPALYRSGMQKFYGWIILPLAILLFCSTVYIKAHYLVDVVGGFIIAPVLLGFQKKHGHYLNRKMNMMEITVKPVESESDLRESSLFRGAFIKIIIEWIPSLLSDDIATFTPERNEAYQYCDTIRLLAFRGQKVVGRIMGIVHHRYNQLNNEKCGRFAFFETYYDREVYAALIKSIEDWARDKGCNRLIGPLGFSDKDPQGF
jgi:glutaredoxin-related protein